MSDENGLQRNHRSPVVQRVGHLCGHGNATPRRCSVLADSGQQAPRPQHGCTRRGWKLTKGHTTPGPMDRAWTLAAAACVCTLPLLASATLYAVSSQSHSELTTAQALCEMDGATGSYTSTLQVAIVTPAATFAMAALGLCYCVAVSSSSFQTRRRT